MPIVATKEIAHQQWKPLDIKKDTSPKPVVQTVHLELLPELHIWDERLPSPSTFNFPM